MCVHTQLVSPHPQTYAYPVAACLDCRQILKGAEVHNLIPTIDDAAYRQILVEHPDE